MTEEEAKTKWCPSVRFVADNGGLASNRAKNGDAPANCIGSACMAWRWLPQKALVASNVDEAREPFTTDRPGDYENNPSWSVERLPLHGGCGLAGAPQP